MEYILYIILNKDIKKDFCLLTPNGYEQDSVNVVVHTNGKKPIDYGKLDCVTMNNVEILDDFVDYFSYGRNIIKNVKRIHIEHKDMEEKNTVEQNKELLDVIKTNDLEEQILYLDVGNISLNTDDVELISSLKECKNSLIDIDNTGIYYSANMLILLSEIIDEIIKRIQKYNFTPLEKMLYTYDLLKTNFMIDPVYEEKMKKLLSGYIEPSYCYAFLFKEVLDRLEIKNIFSSGEFFKAGCRAINIVRIKDDEYGVDGIYYFDISNDSKQKYLNSLRDSTEANDELINSYSGFCKTKEFIVDEGNLDIDFAFGDFDKDFMVMYNYFLEKNGINGVYQLQGVLNNVGFFIDGKTIIDSYHGIKNEDELEDIRKKAESYTELFGNDIDGEDFLELLFNVRKIEYMENRNLFQLNTQTFRECALKSKFVFAGMNIYFSDDIEYEEEDIEDMIEESFDEHFEETINNINLEERIKKLKLSLNNKNNNEDNNDNK